MDSVSKISTKGQVVIPAALRKKHRLNPGASVQIFEYGELICIAPVSESPVADAYGALPRKPSLTKELLKERRKDFADG
jgi:AbrB family looped-hinge helix DNA binding protein